MEEANSNGQQQMLIGFLYLGGVILGVVGFLFRIHWASWNIHHFRLSDEQVPGFLVGWAKGWWSVPFMSLYRPYQVMREIWRRRPPEGVRSHLTVVWWILWVIASALGNRLLSGGLFGKAGESLEGLVVQNNTAVLADAIFLVADALVVILVWQITMAQERKFQGLAQFHSA